MSVTRFPTNELLVLNKMVQHGLEGGGHFLPTAAWNPHQTGPFMYGSWVEFNALGCETTNPVLEEVGCLSVGRDATASEGNVGVLHNYSDLRTHPSSCSPNERVELFINREVRNDNAAMRAVVQAYGLSCLASRAPLNLQIGDLPPPVDSVGDIQRLELWTQRLASVAQESASLLFVTDVPKRVLEAVRSNQVTASAVGSGQHGILLLEFGN